MWAASERDTGTAPGGGTRDKIELESIIMSPRDIHVLIMVFYFQFFGEVFFFTAVGVKQSVEIEILVTVFGVLLVD